MRSGSRLLHSRPPGALVRARLGAEVDDDDARTALTENEGSLLALVLRREPITAYEIVKIYEQSPTTSINSSKGSVYPMIKRLKERGFVGSERVPGDGRNAETLS